MRAMRRKHFFVLILLVIALIGGIAAGSLFGNGVGRLTALISGNEPEDTGEIELPDEDEGEIVRVTRVLDGDTLEIEGGEQVRYIGIDAPENSDESICYGRKSAEINELLVGGKEVRIIGDTQDKDALGRLLRYVFVEDEGGEEIFVNLHLVEEGAAFAVTYPPDTRYGKDLQAAELVARDLERGLWSECKEGKG